MREKRRFGGRQPSCSAIQAAPLAYFALRKSYYATSIPGLTLRCTEVGAHSKRRFPSPVLMRAVFVRTGYIDFILTIKNCASRIYVPCSCTSFPQNLGQESPISAAISASKVASMLESLSLSRSSKSPRSEKSSSAAFKDELHHTHTENTILTRMCVVFVVVCSSARSRVPNA